MTDNEKWRQVSPAFETTREAYEHVAPTDNEKLIDGAVVAMVHSSGRNMKYLTEDARSHLATYARAALAVFEKAHTPTEDEQEALAYLITAFRFKERGIEAAISEPDIEVSRPLAEFLQREGFRRTEVPEPSDEMIAPEDGLTLQELGDAMINASDRWDGDEAMHSIVLRFIEHYADLDGRITEALDSHTDPDDTGGEPLVLFQWDAEEAILVHATPERHFSHWHTVQIAQERAQDILDAQRLAVAKALCAAENAGEASWDMSTGAQREWYLSQADVALRAAGVGGAQ